MIGVCPMTLAFTGWGLGAKGPITTYADSPSCAYTGFISAEEKEARRLNSAFIMKRLRELTNHESSSHTAGISRHSGIADLWASQSQSDL
jgi:hypothetical protein